ncbi:MAG TPA: hypothetical protein VJ579_03580 [Candidatus Paceibacterota bacterium]|nr:hypothetical protein [Candidatus Paceibacterota bacterium]
MNNLQLDDAMICRLVDAHSDGVDFPHAIDLAHIPEMLAPSAKEYWDTLDGTALFSSSILPRADIIDRVFARAGSPVSERSFLSVRPSPYMKYVMAFAVPMAVLVLMVGVSLRPEQGPIAPTLPDGQLTMATFSNETSALDQAPVSAMAAKTAPVAAPAPSAKRVAATMAVSVVPAAIQPVPKDDPRQLFAMISSAGDREARSEATIDETYDAQLAALNEVVINTDNTQNDAPLQ